VKQWALVAMAFVSALIGTELVRRYAIKRSLLDIPNTRSSHNAATPRGGGLAIVLAATITLVGLGATGAVDSSLLAALLLGGSGVALVGYLDDRRQLSASTRLVVHFVAALLSIYLLDGLPDLRFGDHTISFGLSGYIIGSLGIVWVLNLFNFMDGIDGIAASEAAFLGLGGALLGVSAGNATLGGVDLAGLVLAAACCGFLAWNWPPARIFMGDVGSGYIGFVIAVLAIAAGHADSAALFTWLIMGGVFVVDATVTLIRRFVRRERVYEAHRSHAYQWLARRWGSHKRVTVAVILVNVLWLLPCAWLAARFPASAACLVLVALLPIAITAVACGAGRSERPIDPAPKKSVRMNTGPHE
jgi:Fuc2NAc and GlcNAc transferase